MAQKILFLYASPNSGHRACADAVRKAVKILYPAVQTAGADAIGSLFPFLGPLVAKAYLEILRYTPQIWDFLYDNPDIEEITRELRQLFNFLNAARLRELLERTQPRALVCTHAIPCGIIAEQKRRGKCDLPLIAVTTDFAVHSYWVYPEVDLYIVATEESKKTLLARGVKEEKIRVFGIPVDPAFCRQQEKGEAKKKLGLDPSRPVLLIMGGLRGLGPIPEILEETLKLKGSPQVMVVCGMNRDLEKELAIYRKRRGVRLFGYIHAVSALMDAADLLVTKPGGVTSSEALVKGLPMLLVHPIPGQEERNARALLRQGAAVKAQEVPEIKKLIRKLLLSPEQLKQMSVRARKISRPYAALNSARQIAASFLSEAGGRALPETESGLILERN